MSIRLRKPTKAVLARTGGRESKEDLGFTRRTSMGNAPGLRRSDLLGYSFFGINSIGSDIRVQRAKGKRSKHNQKNIRLAKGMGFHSSEFSGEINPRMIEVAAEEREGEGGNVRNTFEVKDDRLGTSGESMAESFRGEEYDLSQLANVGGLLSRAKGYPDARKRHNFLVSQRGIALEREVESVQEKLDEEESDTELFRLQVEKEFMNFRLSTFRELMPKGMHARDVDNALARITGPVQRLRVMSYDESMFRGDKLQGNVAIGHLELEASGADLSSGFGGVSKGAERLVPPESRQFTPYAASPDFSVYNKYIAPNEQALKDFHGLPDDQRSLDQIKKGGHSNRKGILRNLDKILRFEGTPFRDRFISNELHPEYKIYNQAQQQIALFRIGHQIPEGQLRGSLTIYTEFEQCTGCKEVMKLFGQEYPNITVRVIAKFDYPQSIAQRRQAEQ